MAWVKIDDAFDDDPDCDFVGEDGIALFVCSLSWAGRNLTDGFVPADRAKKLPGGDNPATIARLLDDRCRWWVRVPGGYRIRSFLKYNPSAKQVLAERAKTKDRVNTFREKKRQVGKQTAQKGRVTGGITPPVTVLHPPKNGICNTVTPPVSNARCNGSSRVPNPESRIPSPGTTPPAPSLALGEPAPDVGPDVVASLAALGVLEVEARSLAAEFDAAYLFRQMECLPQRGAKNPAAMLVAAIRGRWAPPPVVDQPANDDAERVAAQTAAAELRLRLEGEKRAELDATFAQLDAQTQNEIRAAAETETKKNAVFARRSSGKLFEAAVGAAVRKIVAARLSQP